MFDKTVAVCIARRSKNHHIGISQVAEETDWAAEGVWEALGRLLQFCRSVDDTPTGPCLFGLGINDGRGLFQVSEDGQKHHQQNDALRRIGRSLATCCCRCFQWKHMDYPNMVMFVLNHMQQSIQHDPVLLSILALVNRPALEPAVAKSFAFLTPIIKHESNGRSWDSRNWTWALEQTLFEETDCSKSSCVRN